MDRSEGRTVSIYNAKGDNKVLGGLVNSKGINNKSFYDIFMIQLVFDSPYTLVFAGDVTVPKDDAEVKSGRYYVDGKSTTHAHS